MTGVKILAVASLMGGGVAMLPDAEMAARSLNAVSGQAAGWNVPGLLFAGCLLCLGVLAYSERKREADRKQYAEDSHRREDQLVEIHKEHIIEKQEMRHTMASLNTTLTHFGASMKEHSRVLQACQRTYPAHMRESRAGEVTREL